MSVSGSLDLSLTLVETLTTNVAGSSQPRLTHDNFGKSVTLNSASTPAAAYVASGTQALTAGAYTIDLTSLPATGGGTQSFSTKKLRGYLLDNPSTNSGTFTFTIGASNGHTIGTNWKETLLPGQAVLKYMYTGGETIDATHKTLDVTGSGTESFNFRLVAG